MKKEKQGKITRPYNYHPEDHEEKTADTLALHGKNVEFIRPAWTQGAKTADIMMDGVMWEIKCIMGKITKTTARNVMHKALKQSDSIIIDISRVKNQQKEQVVSDIKKNSRLVRSLKRLIVIINDKEIVEIKK